MNGSWYKFNKNRRLKTVGSTLSVNLPLLDIKDLPAKVDTGALSGALHASNIREITDETGKKQLQFVPLGTTRETVLVDKYHKRKVTSSNGQTSVRYAFETEIEIVGETYLVIITLSNRSSMKYPMLIGRKFLRTHGFLVDVSMHNK